MKNDTVKTESIWMATEELPSASVLAEDIHAEVCVIGAGITGMTTAYMLSREGKSVVVLDKGRVGGVNTKLTTAHLSNEVDDMYSEIERLHGEEGARLAAESHTAAIDRIESIIAGEKIDCDFERVDGYLFTPPGESVEVLEREMEAAHRAGLRGVKFVDRAPLDSFDTGKCLCFPQQGQFHPLKYISGLARGVGRMGGEYSRGRT